MENTIIYVTVRLKDKIIIGNKISIEVNDTEDEKDIAQGIAMQLAQEQGIPLSWVEYGYSESLDEEPIQYYEINF